MTMTIVVSERGRLALAERIDLVCDAVAIDDVVVARGPLEATRRLHSRSVPYLLDVNRTTAGVAAAMAAGHRPYVVDTGDDPSALARSTRGRPTAAAFALADSAVVRRARAVVCRGSFHAALLRGRTGAPVWWAPDTVPDEVIDRRRPAADPCLVATFGSASLPAHGDRAYCWEVIDLVAAEADLRGLVVVNGPGIEALRTRAARRGVGGRVDIEGPRPLAGLVARMERAAFMTSVQSDDVAGWVRTTGKLPLGLGMGKAVVTTRVGEATRVLPDRFLVEPGDDDVVRRGMRAAIVAGLPPGWPDEARHLAERFRRSRVAAGLRDFLGSL